MAPRPSLHRLRQRPRADDWDDGELVSLAEAAAILYPLGPVTAASLRLAHHRGLLPTVEVGGRLHTNLRAVRDAMSPRSRESPSSTSPTGTVPAASDGLRDRIAAAFRARPG